MVGQLTDREGGEEPQTGQLAQHRAGRDLGSLGYSIALTIFFIIQVSPNSWQRKNIFSLASQPAFGDLLELSI